MIHQMSRVEMPQKNGRAEWKHLHILNVAHALLFQASSPIKFWDECVAAAAHLINLTHLTRVHTRLYLVNHRISLIYAFS